MKFISNNFSFYISSRDAFDNVIRSGFIAFFIEKTQKLAIYISSWLLRYRIELIT